MNELTITHLAGLSGLGLVISSWLWSIGGRGNKFWRRFISTAIITTTVNIVSIAMHVWHWWLLAMYVALMGVSLGYGADSTLEKIWRRLLFAFVVTIGGLLFAFTYGGNAWLIYAMHSAIGLFTVFLGVTNPLYAPAEEFFVALLLYLGFIMYPFIVNK